MSRPEFVATEEKFALPVLIVDREGSIGLGLYEHLKKFLQVVLISSHEPADNHHLLFLPFSHKLSSIPDEIYSHIFFRLESKEDRKNIPQELIRKAKKEGTSIVFIIDHTIHQEDIDALRMFSPKTCIVVVGDMFGQPVVIKNSLLVKIFIQAKTKKKIVLQQAGLTEVRPVWYVDVITELIKIAFAAKPQFGVFLLEPPFSVTEIGLAHSLQQVDPMLQIEIIGQPQEITHIPIAGNFVLPTTYAVFEKLQKAYTIFALKQDKGDIILEEDVLSQQIHKQKKKNIGFAITLFILFLIFLPLVSTIFFSLTGGLLFLGAKNAFEAGQFNEAITNVNVAKNILSIADTSAGVLNAEAQTVGLQNLTIPIEESVHAGYLVGDSGVFIGKGINKILLVIEKKSNSPKFDFIDGINSLKKGIDILNNLDISQLSGSAKNILTRQKYVLSLLGNTIDVLPSIMGIDSKKTYLVLFQNNMELRPGGGFVGSYGLLTLNKGSISDFSVHDVYDADGQLKGHVEPPFAIRRYMGIVHLYLRDSNFSPDFTQNAAVAASLFQQEMGQQVEGVIGIDLSYFKNIIGSIGNVFVPEYNETVNNNNFFLLAESHAEKNFFPGSSQKKDFLRSVFAALEKKISGKDVSYGNLFAASIQALQEKHILVAVSKSSIQDVLTANGLSSGLWDPRIPQQNTINDFIGLNEANIGVNKVNAFVTRSLDQRISIASTGAVTSTVTIAFHNASNGQWPGGEYKNYLRLYVPLGSVLQSITIDGERQNIVPAVTNFLVYEKSGFVPPSGLEVENGEENKKSFFGFLVQIPPNADKTIQMIYQEGQSVDISAPVLNYNMWIFKQPGIDDMPYTFSFDYPSSYTLLNSHKTYADDIRKDVQFSIRLTKK